jgi:hypothetical protein
MATHPRHQQGRIRQWDRSHGLHPIGEIHGASERNQSAEGVAHQHRRPLNHLFKKSPKLPSPKTIIEPQPGLARISKSQQVHGVDLPTCRSEGTSIVAPMATAGPKSMNQDEGGMGWIADAAPVTAVTMPVPEAVITPIHAPIRSVNHIRFTVHLSPKCRLQ